MKEENERKKRKPMTAHLGRRRGPHLEVVGPHKDLRNAFAHHPISPPKQHKNKARNSLQDPLIEGFRPLDLAAFRSVDQAVDAGNLVLYTGHEP